MNHSFPFTTCEKPYPENWIAQPYSALVNLLSCLIILFFLGKTKHVSTFLLLFSILCFQAFHMFSHCVHLPGSIQQNGIHALSYAINLALLYALTSRTGKPLNFLFCLFLIFAVSLDIIALCHGVIVFFILCQSILFMGIVWYFMDELPKHIQTILPWLLGTIALLLLLVENESMNGEHLMSWYPDFPFHVFIEGTGLVFFYWVCSHFYTL